MTVETGGPKGEKKVRELTSLERWGAATAAFILTRLVKKDVLNIGLNYSIEGLENYDKAAEYVNSGQGSALVISDHLSFVDPRAWVELRQKLNPEIEFHIPWGKKFTTGTLTVVGEIGTRLANTLGFKLHPIEQNPVSHEERNEAYQVLLDLQEQLLKSNVVGYYPQGTRSRNGLIEAIKGGVDKLFMKKKSRELIPELVEKVLIVPVAIWGTENIQPPDKPEVHLGAAIKAHVGKPFKYAEAVEDSKKYTVTEDGKVRNITVAEAMMLRVVRMMPEKYWGDIFKQILNEPHQ